MKSLINFILVAAGSLFIMFVFISNKDGKQTAEAATAINLPKDQYTFCERHLTNKALYESEMKNPVHLKRDEVLSPIFQERFNLMNFKDLKHHTTDWVGFITDMEIVDKGLVQGVIVKINLFCQNNNPNGEFEFKNNMTDILVEFGSKLYKKIEPMKGGDLVKVTGYVKRPNWVEHLVHGRPEVDLSHSMHSPSFVFEYIDIKIMQ